MNPRSTLVAAITLGSLTTSATLLGAGGESGGSPFKRDLGPGKVLRDPGMREIQVLKDENFKDVTSIVVAPDGKHAYAAAFNPSKLSILDRDPATGNLTLRKALTGKDHNGVVAFRLSADGRYGAASCFRAESLILYSRDPETGDLEKLDVAGGPNDGRAALDFCIDNVFSPDGKHLYTVGSRAIGVFSIENDRLVEGEMACDPPRIVEPQEEAEQQPPREMSGGRGIAISPDGLTVLAAWNSSGTLTVHRRDPKTGKLTHIQTIRDDGDLMVGMEGVMRVTVSRDGRFAYTSGGRFGGLDSVCVFQLRNGHLTLVQNLLAKDLPPNFGGGNEIVLSPNQRQVAVACTNADTVARFQRDPEMGKLTVIGTEECGPAVNPGPAGLCWSPNGRFIHVADEESSCLVTFRLKGR